MVVDLLDQPGVAGQQADGADATGGGSSSPAGDPILNVASSERRLFLFGERPRIDAAKHSPLALSVQTGDTGFHSRSPLWAMGGVTH